MRSALASVGAVVVLMALGCSEEADEGHRAAAVVPAANTACLQARVGMEPAAPAGRRLAARARAVLPVATRTLAALQALPQEHARLEREYQRLFELYRQAATTRRRVLGLAKAVASAEESVRAEARRRTPAGLLAALDSGSDRVARRADRGALRRGPAADGGPAGDRDRLGRHRRAGGADPRLQLRAAPCDRSPRRGPHRAQPRAGAASSSTTAPSTRRSSKSSPDGTAGGRPALTVRP